MESRDADRASITLRDHIDAVVRVIDSLDPAGGKVVLVGHSGGGAVAHAAVDARPDRVAGHPAARELAKIRDVGFIDLPTGHWPQFTRPADLSQAILASVGPVS